MRFEELVATARTCRRFKGSVALHVDVLASLVDMARLAPSARNLQRLRFALVASPEGRAAFASFLVLGGALRPEQRAQAHQQPGGYIVILAPHNLDALGLIDVGIAAQTIQLAAAARGFGACIAASFNKAAAHSALGLPEKTEDANALEAKIIIPLGEADEERRIVPPSPDGSLGYYRDENDVHCVPKHSLDTLIVARI